MATVNILSHDNGVGLTRDYHILKEALGVKSNFVDVKMQKHAPRADINIFLELLNPRMFDSAKVNYFMPNPEWFKLDWMPLLRRFDKILCKTRDTERIFRRLGFDTIYTSFTSEDRYIPSIKKERLFFHGAGKSSMKGTGYTEDVFDKTKGLPPLTRLVSKEKFLSETDFIELQNRHLFHVCCSTYEGFGHYIHEAKSMGAIVITTDGEPMNEFIDSSMGILCKPVAQKQQSLAITKICNAKSIQNGIFRALELTPEEIKEMSLKTRKSWEDNDAFFRTEIKKII